MPTTKDLKSANIFVILDTDFEYICTVMTNMPVNKITGLIKHLSKSTNITEKLAKNIKKNGYSILNEAIVNNNDITVLLSDGTIVD